MKSSNVSEQLLRVGFCGAFEIANYGDHLFPLVFQEALKERNINIELILFSPLEGVQAFDPSIKVFALRDLERIHIEQKLDAIVVGGGELIHFSSSPQLTEQDENYINYLIYETWVIPSLIALKYNIKVIWNVPGCSYEFPEFYKHFAKALCQSVDYISVRNLSSKNILLRSGLPEEQVKLYPDTAFAINKYIDQQCLQREKDNILPSCEAYAVFHTNRHICAADKPKVVDILRSLQEKGLKIVLLPLAYTHNDQSILLNINEMAGYDFITFDKRLSLIEMAGILANCSLYIGISFHGAVTALTYNKKAIVFDYIGSIKTKDLFSDLNLNQFYITNVDQLPEAIEKALREYPQVDLSKYYKQLDTHFDNVKNILCDKNKSDVSYSAFINSISNGINALTKEYSVMYENISKLPGMQQQLSLLAEERNSIQNERDMVQKENIRLNEVINTITNENTLLQNTINQILNSRTWRYATKIKKILPFKLKNKLK